MLLRLVIALALTSCRPHSDDEPAPAPENWRPKAAQSPEARQEQIPDLVTKVEAYLQRGHLYHADQLTTILESRYRDSTPKDKVTALRNRVNEAIAAAPPDGWRNTRWGMSPAEIKALYPQGVAAEQRVFVQVGFFEFAANAILSFTDDKLVAVQVRAPNVFPGKKISRLWELLERKYGPPTPVAKYRRSYDTLHTVLEVSDVDGGAYLRYRSRTLAKRDVESTITDEQMLRDL